MQGNEQKQPTTASQPAQYQDILKDANQALSQAQIAVPPLEIKRQDTVNALKAEVNQPSVKLEVQKQCRAAKEQISSYITLITEELPTTTKAVNQLQQKIEARQNYVQSIQERIKAVEDAKREPQGLRSFFATDSKATLAKAEQELKRYLEVVSKDLKAAVTVDNYQAIIAQQIEALQQEREQKKNDTASLTQLQGYLNRVNNISNAAEFLIDFQRVALPAMQKASGQLLTHSNAPEPKDIINELPQNIQTLLGTFKNDTQQIQQAQAKVTQATLEVQAVTLVHSIVLLLNTKEQTEGKVVAALRMGFAAAVSSEVSITTAVDFRNTVFNELDKTFGVDKWGLTDILKHQKVLDLLQSPRVWEVLKADAALLGQALPKYANVIQEELATRFALERPIAAVYNQDSTLNSDNEAEAKNLVIQVASKIIGCIEVSHLKNGLSESQYQGAQQKISEEFDKEWAANLLQRLSGTEEEKKATLQAIQQIGVEVINSSLIIPPMGTTKLDKLLESIDRALELQPGDYKQQVSPAQQQEIEQILEDVYIQVYMIASRAQTIAERYEQIAGLESSIDSLTDMLSEEAIGRVKAVIRISLEPAGPYKAMTEQQREEFQLNLNHKLDDLLLRDTRLGMYADDFISLRTKIVDLIPSVLNIIGPSIQTILQQDNTIRELLAVTLAGKIDVKKLGAPILKLLGEATKNPELNEKIVDVIASNPEIIQLLLRSKKVQDQILPRLAPYGLTIESIEKYSNALLPVLTPIVKKVLSHTSGLAEIFDGLTKASEISKKPAVVPAQPVIERQQQQTPPPTPPSVPEVTASPPPPPTAPTPRRRGSNARPSHRREPQVMPESERLVANAQEVPTASLQVQSTVSSATSTVAPPQDTAQQPPVPIAPVQSNAVQQPQQASTPTPPSVSEVTVPSPATSPSPQPAVSAAERARQERKARRASRLILQKEAAEAVVIDEKPIANVLGNSQFLPKVLAALSPATVNIVNNFIDALMAKAPEISRVQHQAQLATVAKHLNDMLQAQKRLATLPEGTEEEIIVEYTKSLALRRAALVQSVTQLLQSAYGQDYWQDLSKAAIANQESVKQLLTVIPELLSLMPTSVKPVNLPANASEEEKGKAAEKAAAAEARAKQRLAVSQAAAPLLPDLIPAVPALLAHGGELAAIAVVLDPALNPDLSLVQNLATLLRTPSPANGAEPSNEAKAKDAIFKLLGDKELFNQLSKVLQTPGMVDKLRNTVQAMNPDGKDQNLKLAEHLLSDQVFFNLVAAVQTMIAQAPQLVEKEESRKQLAEVVTHFASMSQAQSTLAALPEDASEQSITTQNQVVALHRAKLIKSGTKLVEIVYGPDCWKDLGKAVAANQEPIKQLMAAIPGLLPLMQSPIKPVQLPENATDEQRQAAVEEAAEEAAQAERKLTSNQVSSTMLPDVIPAVPALLTRGGELAAIAVVLDPAINPDSTMLQNVINVLKTPSTADGVEPSDEAKAKEAIFALLGDKEIGKQIITVMQSPAAINYIRMLLGPNVLNEEAKIKAVMVVVAPFIENLPVLIQDREALNPLWEPLSQYAAAQAEIAKLEREEIPDIQKIAQQGEIAATALLGAFGILMDKILPAYGQACKDAAIAAVKGNREQLHDLLNTLMHQHPILRKVQMDTNLLLNALENEETYGKLVKAYKEFRQGNNVRALFHLLSVAEGQDKGSRTMWAQFWQAIGDLIINFFRRLGLKLSSRLDLQEQEVVKVIAEAKAESAQDAAEMKTSFQAVMQQRAAGVQNLNLDQYINKTYDLGQYLAKQVAANWSVLGYACRNREMSGLTFDSPTPASNDAQSQSRTAQSMNTMFADWAIQGFNFIKTNFNHCSFENSKVKGCDFSEASFNTCSLKNARLERCDFSKVKVTGQLDLSGATIDQYTWESIRANIDSDAIILSRDTKILDDKGKTSRPALGVYTASVMQETGQATGQTVS